MSSIPERKSSEDDPVFTDLRERIATLEVHTAWIRKSLEKLDKRMNGFEQKQWAVLVSVVLTILLVIWNSL